MRKLLIFSSAIILLASGINSCKKVDPPLPGWTPGIEGLGKYISGTFKSGAMDISNYVFSLQWNNNDKNPSVAKMQVYVHFIESYYDSVSAQAKTVEHFTSVGKTNPAWDITNPAIRTPYNVTITPDQVYQLFKDIKFDYKDGKGSVFVFDNTRLPLRNDPKTRFRFGDKFYVTWAFTTPEGDVYKSWSVSIQNNEVTGSDGKPFLNTRLNWDAIK
jgi:hypothetical protein